MITGKVKAKALKIGIYLAIGLLIIIIALMSDGRIPGMRGTGSAQSLLDVAFGEYGTVGAINTVFGISAKPMVRRGVRHSLPGVPIRSDLLKRRLYPNLKAVYGV